MHPVLAYMEQHKQAIINDLQEFVTLESPSLDKAAVDRLSRVLAERFAAAGASTEFIGREERGDLLRMRWGQGREPGQTMVLCHMDTVFNIGDIAKNPLRIENGRLYGPGTSDMKAGFTLLLWALRCMQELGLQPRREVLALLTSDEEIGSHASRSVIEEEARRSAIALVAEPAMPPKGALKTWRKGTADYRLHITGKPAHAGADPTKGISAVEELAHHILTLQKLTDMSVGTTVNVGVISGGSRANVVAPEAYAHIDVRFMTMEEAQRIDSTIRGLKPVLPGIGLRVEGGMNRPPMVRNDATVALFRKAQALAAELGLEVDEMGTGGASDGNFTSGAGCPTIDGLGACGDGLHTFDEYVEIDSLPVRAALLVRLLQEA
ncbi:MAG TPA: M20 family metallopeptidase [Symbiobacteriaceae bacterium]|nr:M20 family metallopeptidase [Symbiobacteriaceae bacterium]